MYIKRYFFISFIVKFPPKPFKKKVQGCALRKIEGISLVLWICEIQGTQLVISMKKITFPNSPRAKVRCLKGPLSAYKTQPSALILVKLQNMSSSLVSFAWCNQVLIVSAGWVQCTNVLQHLYFWEQGQWNLDQNKLNQFSHHCNPLLILWKFKQRITGPLGLIRSNHA